jgi:hypothetical protein
MRANLSLRDYEQISAYLDGQLSVRDKARFEQQLGERPDLKTAYDDMSRTRSLLRMAPHRHAPRNFTLTPAMVQQNQPKRSFGLNLFPAFGFASALAALLLVATILFELLPGVNAVQTGAAPEAARSAENTADSTSMLQSAPMATAPAGAQQAVPNVAPAPENKAEASPIITWGVPQVSNSNSAVTGKGGGPGIDSMGQGGYGGGGPSDLTGIGGGAPDGNLVVPLESAQSLPAPSQAQELQTPQDFSSVPTLEGTGPILGVPPVEKEGQYNAPLPTALPDRDLYSTMPGEAVQAETVQPASVPVLRWVQLALGTIAVLTALAAFWAWRRTR